MNGFVDVFSLAEHSRLPVAVLLVTLLTPPELPPDGHVLADGIFPYKRSQHVVVRDADVATDDVPKAKPLTTNTVTAAVRK